MELESHSEKLDFEENPDTHAFVKVFSDAMTFEPNQLLTPNHSNPVDVN